MKKFLSTALIILLVLSCIFVFAACDDKDDKPTDNETPSGDNTTNNENDGNLGGDTACVHVDGEFIVDIEPTKTENGSGHLICEKCKETLETRVLYATGSQGLEYRWNPAENTYSIIGVGDCKDADVVIPAIHNDFPVVEIEYKAFNDYVRMKSITIPDTLTKIGDYVFYGCTRFNAIYISNMAAWTETEFAEHSFYRYPDLYLNGELVTEIVIPDEVERIGNYAFVDCPFITDLTIPDNVKIIGEGAFMSCDNLNNVIMSDGIESVGSNAFSKSTRLKFNEYENAEYLGNESNGYIVLVKAKDKNISSVIIHPTAKVISDEAFKGCNLL